MKHQPSAEEKDTSIELKYFISQMASRFKKQSAEKSLPPSAAVLFLFASLRQPLSDPGRLFEKATREAGFTESLCVLVSILRLSLYDSNAL